jgi:hypothetical protein
LVYEEKRLASLWCITLFFILKIPHLVSQIASRDAVFSIQLSKSIVRRDRFTIPLDFGYSLLREFPSIWDIPHRKVG